MTRIACLTDTHWSARKASRHLHDYFELFYKNVFFPTLEKEGITTVIHMGDAFDNRKSIDFWGLDWTRRVVLDPLSKYETHIIVGNHDAFLRNSTEINAPDLLLREYSNIKTYSSPQTVKVGDLDILMVPWICSENYDETLNQIKNSKAKVAMGHLELQGFRVNRNLVMEDHGTDPKLFDKFIKVFSGHYHTRSDNGKIFYLGNPYEMYWTDVNDTRGFHIFDTETLIHTPVNNPYKLFYHIYYEDTPHQLFDATEYKNKIVKVIVRKKSKPRDFEKFIDKLYTAGIQELKIVENFDFQESENFEIDEEESTISILNRYIDEAEFEFDKNVIKGIFQDLYKQSCEVE
ncbi:recombinase [bacterium]|nr:recombinase [Candidatus Elulimicrobium humile]